MCDIDVPHVYSHAKALSRLEQYNLYFFDVDATLAETLAAKYKGKVLKTIEEADAIAFEWVSIAVPTAFHYEYYKRFAGKVKYILLEKPVSYSLEECEKTRQLKEKTGQLTYVNYMREFLPAYHQLKKALLEIEKQEPFSEVSITYHRGIINNGSHALSLLSFLFDKVVTISDPALLSSKKFRGFGTDTTLSVHFRQEQREFYFTGLDEKKYPIFEINLFSANHQIKISNSGDTIEVFRQTASDINGVHLQRLLFLDQCLSDYMSAVVSQIFQAEDTEQTDNFENAYTINKELIQLCQNLL
jgi:predicted dehydrogenase